ncbi:MAG: hypothetical protein ACLQVI_25550, partial [Polyangiaceae bacterium]
GPGDGLIVAGPGDGLIVAGPGNGLIVACASDGLTRREGENETETSDASLRASPRGVVAASRSDRAPRDRLPLFMLRENRVFTRAPRLKVRVASPLL